MNEEKETVLFTIEMGYSRVADRMEQRFNFMIPLQLKFPISLVSCPWNVPASVTISSISIQIYVATPKTPHNYIRRDAFPRFTHRFGFTGSI